ncbi:gata-4 5 6 transcription factor [Ceraceosorus bombacis]|uniref:Gata-4 5 6 transcription factor n=1 Tax=Ceraceosorus bombacis TaxID=401625 RepID=A0A0P1BRS4_9BASI|nr:gata-4 5 6 transcription factor [Ceraceosorus bombacis]
MRTSPITPLSPELDGDYMQAHGGLLLPGHANMMDVDDDSELKRTGSLSSSGPARRQKPKSQPKRVRKRENEGHQQCLGCDAIETPEWRRGPMGNRTLCNACGLLYAKQKRKKAKEAANATGQKGSAAGMEETEEEKLAALEELRAAVLAKSASLATASLPYLAQASAYGPPASSLIDAGHHLQRPLPPLPPKAASTAELYSNPVASSPSRFFPMSHQPPPPPPRFFEGPRSDVADRQGGAMPQIHGGRPSLPPFGTFFQPADPSRLDAPLPLLPHEKSGGLSAPALAFDNERAHTSNGGTGLPPPAIWASRRQL